MSILSILRDWRSPKVPPASNSVVKGWKAGMWVMYLNKIAILVSVGDLCEIHFTDTITGENIGIGQVPLGALRQARYPEIPVQRRLISAEKALELGYGP